MIARTRVTPEMIRYVVTHMRDRDIEELDGVYWPTRDNLFDVPAFCQMVAARSGDMCWCFHVDTLPATILGAWCLRPNVWEVVAFGTWDWPRAVLSMTRHIRRFIIPALKHAGAHRVQAHAMATHADSRRWIEALGGHEEATLKKFGRTGEDYVLYVWDQESV